MEEYENPCPAFSRGEPCLLAKNHGKIKREVRGSVELWNHISTSRYWDRQSALARPKNTTGDSAYLTRGYVYQIVEG